MIKTSFCVKTGILEGILLMTDGDGWIKIIYDIN